MELPNESSAFENDDRDPSISSGPSNSPAEPTSQDHSGSPRRPANPPLEEPEASEVSAVPFRPPTAEEFVKNFIKSGTVESQIPLEDFDDDFDDNFYDADLEAVFQADLEAHINSLDEEIVDPFADEVPIDDLVVHPLADSPELASTDLDAPPASEESPTDQDENAN